MSITLNTSKSEDIYLNPENQTTEVVSENVDIALKASRLSEEILAMMGAPLIGLNQNIPPITADNNIYRNPKLISYANLDETITYRYVMKKFAIYGTTIQECEQVYKLLQSLEFTDQGRLILKLVLEDIANEKLYLFGHPKSRINQKVLDISDNKMLAVFVQRVTRGGNYLDGGIIIPIKKPLIAQKMHLNHELGHYLVSRLTLDRSTCPLKDLPLSSQNDFLELYHSVRARFSNNPHPRGTNNWKQHELVKSLIFDKIKLYPTHRHGAEIPAYISEFELTFPGFLKKHGAGDLVEATNHVLYKQRTLPKTVLDHLSNTISRPIINNTQDVPIDLNLSKRVSRQAIPHPENQLPKGIRMAWQGLQYGMTLLELIRLSSDLRDGIHEEAERLPFTSPFDAHETRGSIRGFVRYIADTLLFQLHGFAAVANQGPLDFNTALSNQQIIENMKIETTKIARKWERKLTDMLIDKWDLNKNPYAAKAQFEQFMSAMGKIQLPKDFLSWSPEKQEQWGNALIAQAESLLANSKKTYSQLAAYINPDLSTLETVSSLSLPNIWIDPDLLSQLTLNLPWSMTTNSETQTALLQTTVEIAPDALTTLADQPEIAPFITHAPLQKENTYPEKLKFSELSEFTHVELGKGIGGGGGLILTMRSGAKVSLSFTPTSIMTGLSIPLGAGFTEALLTATPYAAPIAAALIALKYNASRNEKAILNRLKSEGKAAKKEGNQVNASLRSFDHFSDLFGQGLIDKETFLGEVNQIAANIQQAADHMKKRGSYAKNHGQQTAGADYFFEASNLQQIELELKKIAAETVAKKEFADQYMRDIQCWTLPTLVKELSGFANQRVLCFSDKFKHDALIKEISIRDNSSELDSLGHLDLLAGHSAAITLNPKDIEKPHRINVHQFRGGSDSSRHRKQERTQNWANNLDEAYCEFKTAAHEGKIPEMKKAADKVNSLLDNPPNLKKYRVTVDDPNNDKKTIDTRAYTYYEPYITEIRSNVKTTMDRYKVVEDGKITAQSPEIFSSNEIKAIKIQAGAEAFNHALSEFDSTSQENKDQAFSGLNDAALFLQTLGITDPSILNVITIGKEHGTYSQYQAETDRLKRIKMGIVNLQEKTAKMKKLSEPEEKSIGCEEDYETLFRSAFEITEELLSSEALSKADINKIFDNPDDAEAIFNSFQSVQEGYPLYKKKLERLNNMQEEISSLQKKTEELNNLKLKREGRLAILKEREKMAKDFLNQGYSEEDVGAILANKEEAGSIFKWVQSITEEYPHLIKIDHYQHEIHHRYSSPAIRFAIHVLNDQQQRFYSSSSLLRRGTQGLGIVNTIVPELLPSGTTFLIGAMMREDACVIDALYKNCSRALENNALVALKGHISNYKTFFDKSFSKQVSAFQGANAVVQLVTRAGSNYPLVSQSAWVVNIASNALYHRNTLKKTVKYLELAKFGEKAHKVNQGLMSLGTAVFDIYEFLATDASEWGASKGLIQAVKEYLPNFHGNLPEYKEYYVLKDMVVTAGAAAACAWIGGPITIGLASLQAASTAYKTYYSGFTDDVLAAIMINVRYFSEKKEWQKKCASMANLLNHLGDNNIELKTSDSPIVQKAKQCRFEFCIELLAKQEKWQEVIESTVVDPVSCTFAGWNIDLFDAVDALLKRYSALVNAGNPSHLLLSLNECEKVSAYLEKKFAGLEEKHKAYIESVRSQLHMLKQCLITNICVHFIKGHLETTAMEAVTLFDKVPKENRNCIHWYLLGKAALDFPLPSHKLQKRSLLGLQLVCFEAAWGLLAEKKRSETLTAFEKELIPCCKKILKVLGGTVKEGLAFSRDTERFAPEFERIFAGAITANQLSDSRLSPPIHT